MKPNLKPDLADLGNIQDQIFYTEDVSPLE